MEDEGTRTLEKEIPEGKPISPIKRRTKQMRRKRVEFGGKEDLGNSEPKTEKN